MQRKSILFIFIIVILLLAACEVDNNELACKYNGRIRDDLTISTFDGFVPTIKSFEASYLGNIGTSRHLLDDEYARIMNFCLEFLADNYRINYSTSFKKDKQENGYKFSDSFVKNSGFHERMLNLKNEIVDGKADLNIDSIEFSKNLAIYDDAVDGKQTCRYYFRVNWMLSNPLNINNDLKPTLINGYNFLTIIIYFTNIEGSYEITAVVECFEDPFNIHIFEESSV